jgi:hypothetical protein
MKDGFLEAKEIKNLVTYLTDPSELEERDKYYFSCLQRINGEAMLYGTGTAQSGYLRAEMIMNTPPRQVNEANVKRALEDSSIGGKTQFARVSNYWLEQVQSKTNTTLSGEVFKAKKGAEDKGEFWNRFDQSKLSMGAFKEKQGGTFPVTAPKAAPKPLSTPVETRDVVYDVLIRRSCKFLMYDAIDQGKKIFYALDELDLPRVAYLVNAGAYPATSRVRRDDQDKIVYDAEGKIPVCSSELREIFRYWDYFQRHIVFFEGLYKTTAPWERPEQADPWAAYAKHRAAKLLAAVGSSPRAGSLKDRVDLCQGASSAEAIHIYHDLGATKFLGRGGLVNATSVVPEGKRAPKGRRNKGF